VRVFVDTNVWLAGRFGRGLCADLLDTLVEENMEILIDERVHAEFRPIGRDKFRVDERTLDEADIFFLRYTRILPAADRPAPGIADQDDAWIITAALMANTELFVTGDKALLALESVEGMSIADPRTTYIRLRGLD
jgi:putative PIN family toxin of toxin-antitoxin system